MPLPKCIYKLDRRFEYPEDETNFKQSLQTKVALAGFIMSITTILSLLAGSTLVVGEVMREDFPFRFSDVTRNVMCFWLMGVFVLASMLLSVTAATLKGGMFQTWNWELIILFYVTVIAMSVPWVDPWRLAQLFGEDPTKVWAFDTRGYVTTEALILDSSVTFLCLFVPIRTCWCWLAPVFILLSYGVVTLLVGSQFPESAGTHACALVVLSYGALHGQFWNEVNNRHKFVFKTQVRRQEELLLRQYLGVSRILTRLCDCMVKLGPDFQIMEPSKQLAALLLSSGIRQLEGRSFSDYMSSDEDWQRFVAALQERVWDSDGGEESLDVGMILVHLRDSRGKEFAAHIHHTCFHDLDNTRHYLVGILEKEERGIPGNDVFRNPVALEKPIQYSSTEESEVSSGQYSLVPLDVTAPAEEVSAWVDLGRTGLPVFKFTPGFTLLTGPSQFGIKLLDMCTQPTRLIKWLQDEMRDIVDDDVGYHPTSVRPNGTTFSGKFRYPGASGCLIESQVQCNVDLDKSANPVDDVDFDDAAIPVLIRFLSITQHRVVPRRRRLKELDDAIIETVEPITHSIIAL